jgi:catechol 2,3-dioxygenase-like lactoylglutathione lyase family enzyme
MFRLEGIDHVALTVRDVERSAAWYQEVLGLRRLHQHVWGSHPAVVGVGTTALALFPVAGADPDGPPGRETICVRHIAFRVDRRNFEEARAELHARGIEVEFQDHQIAHSIYLLDPDRHQLEITTYEL